MSASLARRSILRAVGTAPAYRASALTPLVVRRWATTQSITPQENIALLNEQRLHRPNSPHMTIYQPQVTWYLSIFNRMTGVGLSTALYAASFLYLLHPVFPVLDSAHLIQLASDLPVWFKGILKLPLSIAFTFHTFNGIRHLAWDIGYGLTIKGVYAGAYVTMAATAISSFWLSFFV